MCVRVWKEIIQLHDEFQKYIFLSRSIVGRVLSLYSQAHSHDFSMGRGKKVVSTCRYSCLYTTKLTQFYVYTHIFVIYTCMVFLMIGFC